jgi:hypothetical protein
VQCGRGVLLRIRRLMQQRNCLRPRPAYESLKRRFKVTLIQPFVVLRLEIVVAMRMLIQPVAQMFGWRSLTKRVGNLASLSEIFGQAKRLNPDSGSISGFDGIHKVFDVDHVSSPYLSRTRSFLASNHTS